jgi:hypothetical protein
MMKITVTIPDRSITRTKLEYPTTDVSLAYLVAINMFRYVTTGIDHVGIVTIDAFTDKAIEGICFDTQKALYARSDGVPRSNTYVLIIDHTQTTGDFYIMRWRNGLPAIIGSEAIDLGIAYHTACKLSCLGSSLKAYRIDMAIPRISVTDTALASGYFGTVSIHSKIPALPLADYLRAPSSPAPPALATIELEVEGDGTPENPYKPRLQTNLVEITSLEGLPSFLYQEAKKYEILKNKGFTEDEMKLLLGYIPQYKVNLGAVTWGAFGFSEESPTNIVIITEDNPYQQGAIQRQAELARSRNLRVLDPPRNYGEAVAQYNQLKRDYPHWLVGKDNYAYQVLGWEELDLFQNVDFYYGELIEHKTHYDQLKRIPEWELERRLEELERRLERITILTEERDKHLAKLRGIKRLGW